MCNCSLLILFLDYTTLISFLLIPYFLLRYFQIIKNGVPLSTCTIKDPGSKYGNFIVNDGTPEIKIPKGEEGYSVKHMDKIRFGLQNYIYT